MRLSFLFLPVLALIAIEIAGFVVVGREIGALVTIVLVFLSSALGLTLLRIQGFGALTRIRQEMDKGRVPGRELAHGFMIVVAGMLLIIPGFVTDLIGLLLFIPPVRDLGWAVVKKRISVVQEFSWTARPHARPSRTIDLETDEYSRNDKSESPWRRLDRR